MQKIPKEEIDELVKKYTKKIEGNISRDKSKIKKNTEFSKEYEKFREAGISTASSRYEKLAQFASKIIKVKPNQEILPKIEESIDVAHLNITPGDAASFSIFYPIVVSIVLVLLAVIAYIFEHPILTLFLVLLFLISLLFINVLTKIPINLANKWRVKASNQIVLCVLYIVVYMRHTSNLENAIKFASDHVGGPIALDLKKVFWDVEVGKYSTIKESLDHYLILWRDNNLAFVNSVHLIESSLYEPNEDRRLTLLDKSLQTILDGIYSDMMHYSRELKNPITMLHMLGIILPILGLIIFPLLGSFLGGFVKWYHLAVLYNILLPLLVYNFGLNILSKRPAGYSETLSGFEKVKGNFFVPFLIILIFLIIGLSPFILYAFDASPNFEFMGMPFFDFESKGDKLYGPYGVGALLLSFFIPLGIALGLGFYFVSKTKNLFKLRQETKKLEKEFSSSLFQLGTRIGDGIPTESAFKDVAQTMKGTPTGNLFWKIHTNLTKLGMSLKNAIFDRQRGAIVDYPSPLVESSMEVLIEGSKKGPGIVSKSLISISNYVNSVHSVSERLKDLLADVIASMKSQINFMAPVIAGIVVGIASMIVGVISKLEQMAQLGTEGTEDVQMNLMNIADLFSRGDTIPSYFFQIIVGIFVVQVVYILSVLSSGIEFGADKLNEQNSVGKNLIRSILIYTIVSLIIVLLFNKLSSFVLNVAT